MSIKLKIKDFFYPVSILKLRAFLEKSQWMPQEQLIKHQKDSLKVILDHAYANVPYYKRLFDRNGILPKDIREPNDLKKIPLLTRDLIRKNRNDLVARNAAIFKPVLNRTTGTSGEPLEFYKDKPSNVMEFCYYWRYWSWAGYKLGVPFAEFSLSYFMKNGTSKITEFSRVTNRLCINPGKLSVSALKGMVKAIKRHSPLYLKGVPSTIYMFALLLEKERIEEVTFTAVFTTGEMLVPYQREKIQQILKCTIFDSYGQMEGVVAAAQCEYGEYHINSEYGILEIDGDGKTDGDKSPAGKIIGTSLSNMAMPLIRYDTGDIAENLRGAGDVRCGCGRTLPVCGRIAGRQQDVIITPEGRYLTNIFVLFGDIKGIRWIQVIQEKKNRIRVDIVKEASFLPVFEQHFLDRIKELTGKEMKISVNYLSDDSYEKIKTKKYKPVVSYVQERLGGE